MGAAWRDCVGDLFQQLCDAVLVPDTLIELELHFRRPAQAEALADLPAHEARCPLECASSVLSGSGIAEARVEHTGVLQVGAHLHTGDGDEPDAWIVQLARDDHADFRANLVRDALRSRALAHKLQI